jgi:PKD repeat protein
MGSRFRRRVGVLLLASAVALAGLAVVAAHSDDPHPVLTVDDSHPLVGQVVHFHASPSDDEDESVKIVAYDFAFGDGTDTGWQSSADASHAYATAGTYTAKVTAKDKDGETGTASRELHVRSASVELRVPDLVPILAMAQPAAPRIGDPVVVSIVLVNQGNGTAIAARIVVTDQRPDETSVLVGNLSLPTPVPAGNAIVLSTSPFPAAVLGNHTLVVNVTDVRPNETARGDSVLDFVLTVLPSTGPPVSSPNLVPVSIDFSPANPVAGDRVTVIVGLRNNGTATAQQASIRVLDVSPNGNITLVGVVPLGDAVPPSGWTIVRAPPFVASTVGNHTILVLVENVSPGENDTSDNVRRATLFVGPSGGAGGSGGNAGGLPVSAWIAIALLGTAAAAAAGSSVLLRRRSKPGFLEPPPAEPPDFSPPPLAPL